MLTASAWTTCPYVGRDGQVNPDVRDLNGPDGKHFDVLKECHELDKQVLLGKMNPNMNFGQIVRGPGPDGFSGTFKGVLDLRGIVKIINGIAIVKAAGSPDWTQAFDQQMLFWLTDHVSWLKASSKY